MDKLIRPDEERLSSGVDASIKAYCEALLDFSFDPVNPFVRLHEPTFGADEILAAVRCMLSTRVTMGEKVSRFEREFTDKFGFAHGVMNNSGSSANLLAVAALTNPQTKNHLNPGDEVIVPALAWSTTVWALIQHNLVPVVVDIDPGTLNIDPNEIERAVGPRTRAVMVVHVYGNPCEMDSITDMCNRHHLSLIEDCCEALGASYKNISVGRFGKAASFSFYFSHHITTFEGGICVSDDDELAEMMRILRSHGWIRNNERGEKYTEKYPEIDPRFLFVNLGYNLRPMEFQAAVGSVQLPKLNSFVNTRRENAAHWLRDLARFGGVFSFQQEMRKGRHSWFGFPITVKDGAPFTVKQARDFLARNNIETRPIICGNIARQPGLKLYKHRVVGDLRHSDKVMRDSFTFGNHQAVDANARQYVTAKIEEFMSQQGVR